MSQFPTFEAFSASSKVAENKKFEAWETFVFLKFNESQGAITLSIGQYLRSSDHADLAKIGPAITNLIKLYSDFVTFKDQVIKLSEANKRALFLKSQGLIQEMQQEIDEYQERLATYEGDIEKSTTARLASLISSAKALEGVALTPVSTKLDDQTLERNTRHYKKIGNKYYNPSGAAITREQIPEGTLVKRNGMEDEKFGGSRRHHRRRRRQTRR
jgi:hypothetical protein